MEIIKVMISSHILLTIVGIIVGALSSWGITRHYSKRGSEENKELKEKVEQLQRLTALHKTNHITTPHISEAQRRAVTGR